MVKLMVTLIEIDIDINKNLQECGQAAERSSALLCQCCLSGISPFALTVQNAPKHLQTEQGRSNLISRYFQREVEEGLGSSPFSSSPFSYNSWERRSSLSGGSRERQVMVNLNENTDFSMIMMAILMRQFRQFRNLFVDPPRKLVVCPAYKSHCLVNPKSTHQMV